MFASRSSSSPLAHRNSLGKCGTFTPSPGTPGEGRGEGDFEHQQAAITKKTPTPALPRSTRRGGKKASGFDIRTSSFGFDSGFGFRNSDFPAGRRPRGFTLIELLVVIGIIILVVAMAIPAIRSLTGTHSIDAGYNTLSALITQAREDAVGIQGVRGVLFYLDAGTGRVAGVIVQETPPPDTTPNPAPTYYLDALPNVDYVELPPGVGVQCLNNANSPRTTDGYLGLNPLTGITTSDGIKYGGVILFDGNGRLISATYGFKLFNSTSTTPADTRTNLAKLFTVTNLTPTSDFIPPAATGLLSSQFGFVLFDRDAFNNQQFTDGDTGMDLAVTAYGASATPGTEAAEETWLDANATPILVNRYNGTLIRAE